MTQLQTVLELPLFVAGHYLGLLLFLAVAWSLGRTLTRRLAYRTELEAVAVSAALGLGVTSTALFLLAVVGLFRPVPILVLVAGSQYVCRRSWLGAWAALRRWLEAPRSVAWIFCALVLALLLAPLLSLPLYPPTAFDATMFHLPLAEAIAEEGRIDFFEDLRYPVFPALQEVLYATALLFRDDVAASMVHFGCFLLVGLLLYCWGSWLSSGRAGLWAALLWLGVNAAIRAAIGAYVDCGLALYVGTALFCLHRYGRRGERGWLAVAAALLGFGAATKYHGLYFVCMLSVGVAIHTLLQRRFRHLISYAAALAAAMLPWYAFIYYHTGSPIFPFFPAVFGMSPWAYELRYSGSMPASQVDAGPIALLGKIGMLFRIFFNKAILLFDRSLIPTLRIPVEIFQDTGAYKGAGLSPMFLFGLPLVVVMIFRHRHARYMILIAGVYLIAWAATAQDLRYILPALPIVALLAAEGVDRLVSKLTPSDRSWMAWALTMAIAIPLALQVNWVSSGIGWTMGRPPTTLEKRDRFLEIRLRSYAAIRTLNARHGADFSVYGLFSENMKYFVEGQHLGDWFGPSRYGLLLGKLQNRDALQQTLRQMGAQYLLVPDLETWRSHLAEQFPLPTSETLAPSFEVAYEDRYARIYRVVPSSEAPPPEGVDEPPGGEPHEPPLQGGSGEADAVEEDPLEEGPGSG